MNLTKAKRAELESGWRERNVRLREMGLPKESFDQYLIWAYGRGAQVKTVNRKSPVKTTGSRYVPAVPAKASINDSRHWTTGATSSKPSQTYTGHKIVGIGMMHKSNLVPVFSDQEATDLASMRR